MADKAPLRKIELNRERGLPQHAETTSFAEANLILEDWAQNCRSGDTQGEVSIAVFWSNGGYFRLKLFLEYPVQMTKVDIRRNIEFLIAFSLGEATYPNHSEAANAHMLAQDKKLGLDEHCLLVRETCLIDDVKH